MVLIEPLNDPVAVSANKKIPTIHTMVVSLLIIIKPIIKRMNKTYIQWSAVSSIPIAEDSLLIRHKA